MWIPLETLLMFNEAVKILESYGWAALLLFVSGVILLRYLSRLMKVWSNRDKEQTEGKQNAVKLQLMNHQLFTNIDFKVNNEIKTLDFNGQLTPIRQKLFRKLLEIDFACLGGSARTIVEADVETMTASEWAGFVISQLADGDRCIERAAIEAAIPIVVVNKFMVWRQRTKELLHSYVKDLAVSTVYTTNGARTNTFLYLVNLQLITSIGDAEKTLIQLNGEISGLPYDGDVLE